MTARQHAVPPVFGLRLRRERESRQWSMREAGEKSGLNASTIMRIEAGNDAGLSSAIILTRLYGLSMDALLTETACGGCGGMPPAGFACLTCGTEGQKPAATRTGD